MSNRSCSLCIRFGHRFNGNDKDTHLSRDGERTDFVEGDKRNAPAGFQQPCCLCTCLLVLDDDLVQFAASSNLQGGSQRSVIFPLQRDERSTVKTRRGGNRVEAESSEATLDIAPVPSLNGQPWQTSEWLKANACRFCNVIPSFLQLSRFEVVF